LLVRTINCGFHSVVMLEQEVRLSLANRTATQQTI